MEGELKTAQVPGLTLSLIIFTPGLAWPGPAQWAFDW